MTILEGKSMGITQPYLMHGRGVAQKAAKALVNALR